MDIKKPDWIPFYNELLNIICKNYDAESLYNIWLKYFPHKYKDIRKMDPFTFVARTLSRQKENKFKICENLKKDFGLKSDIPKHYEEPNGMPSLKGAYTFFCKSYRNLIIKDEFKESEAYKKALSPLWDLAKQVIDNNIKPETYNQCIKLTNAGPQLLTQIIFICNPNVYYSLDEINQNYLKNNGIKFSLESSYDSFIDFQLKAKQINPIPYVFSIKAYIETDKQHYKNENQNGDNNMKQPLNQILYGPPGTGKTYNTITYAVAAVENKDIETVKNEPYDKVKQRYDSYKLNKQIEFITFHQSYSYEEFVEGIKPYIPEWGEDKEQDVKYVGKDGIFKNICDKAKNIKNTNIAHDYNFENMSFYKLWLSDPGVYEYCKENNCVSLSWAGEFDFTECTNTDMIKEKIPNDYQQKNTARSQLDIFKNRIDQDLKQGKDVIVIVPESKTSIRAIGKIVGAYEYSQEIENISHKRKVEWIKTDISVPYDSVYSATLQTPAISRMISEQFKKENFMDLINNKNTIKSENCVLIIDEINRGNISKIFGELITLIEEDKREKIIEDNKKYNTIKVKLPYSNQMFSVPNNLYIIGTMNTADRSIALLDTALRRRFDFEEMMPDLSLLDGKSVELDGDNIDLQKLLEKLNKNICEKGDLDKNHQIGHAYLINVDDKEKLRRAFLNKIYPLLEEYFYDEEDKIKKVLDYTGDLSKIFEPNNKTWENIVIGLAK